MIIGYQAGCKNYDVRVYAVLFDLNSIGPHKCIPYDTIS